MLEGVLLGDNDVTFEVFPQRPAPISVPDTPKNFGPADKLRMEQHYARFASDFRPIIVRPQVRSLGGIGSALLLIPDGMSFGRPNEPSYMVLGVNDNQDLTYKRHIDHLPISRRRENRDKEPQVKERLKYLAGAFLNNRLGEFFDQQHYDKSNDSDLSLIFDTDEAVKVAAKGFTEGLKDRVSSITLEFNKGVAPKTRRFNPDFSATYELFKEHVKAAIEKWQADAFTPEVLETMSGLEGQQNNSVYSYLAVRLSRSKKKKIDKQDLTRETMRANRCAALRQFPLLASDLGRFEKHSISDGVDKGRIEGQEVAARYWKADGRQLGPEELSLLEGLSEKDVTEEVAGDFYRVAPYLAYLDSTEQFPQTPQEWMAFRRIVNTDARYEKSHFRHKGQTVSEIVDMMDSASKTPWQDAYKLISFVYRDTHLSVADTIINMAGRVGLSRLAPIMLNMRDQEELAPNIKDVNEIIAFCDVATPERQSDLNSQGRKVNEAAGLCLIGRFYEDVHLKDLIYMQRAFATGSQRDWDRDIRRLAVSSRFSDAAGNQKIEALPRLPDELQRDNTRYEIVPVASAGEAVYMLRDMKSRKAWDILEDMVYQPVHFVFCVKSFNGDTEALCVLEEIDTGDGKLRVRLRDTAIGRDDERVDISNELSDKIHTYIEYINDLDLPIQPFKRSRERLRLNAEKLVGERGSIGHDRRTIKENVQAANRFKDSCPDALKVNTFEGGLRYSCPTLSGDESVYVFLRRHLMQLDPKFKGFTEEHGLRCVIDQ